MTTRPAPSPRFQPLLAVVLALVAWFLAGCGPKSTSPAADSHGSKDSPQAASAATAPAAGKIKFKDDSGATLYSLKPKEDGAKLVDPAEKELARFNAANGKLKIKSPTDEVLGYVVGTSDRFKVTSPDQGRTLFKLQRQEDGDWKLEDGEDGLIYKIKKREYGFEIEDPKEQSLAKIKVKEGKTSLRDPQERTRVSTHDPIEPIALACLGFDRVEDLRLRAGLLHALNAALGSR